MMVGGGVGRPPRAAWLGPDWIRAPGRAPSCPARCATFHAERTPQPPELKHGLMTRAQGAAVS
jgi:hypothetical protein